MKTKCKKEIQQATKTYKWMQKKGIDLSRFKVESLIVYETITLSSFKERAERVKHEFNHKFNPKRDIDDGILALYERVNRLTFERA